MATTLSPPRIPHSTENQNQNSRLPGNWSGSWQKAQPTPTHTCGSWWRGGAHRSKTSTKTWHSGGCGLRQRPRSTYTLALGSFLSQRSKVRIVQSFHFSQDSLFTPIIGWHSVITQHQHQQVSHGQWYLSHWRASSTTHRWWGNRWKVPHNMPYWLYIYPFSFTWCAWLKHIHKCTHTLFKTHTHTYPPCCSC